MVNRRFETARARYGQAVMIGAAAASVVALNGVDFQNPNLPSFGDLQGAIDYINANTTPRVSGYERWVVRLFERDGRGYTWTVLHADERAAV